MSDAAGLLVDGRRGVPRPEARQEPAGTAGELEAASATITSGARVAREAMAAPLRNPATGGISWYHGTRAGSAQLAGGFRVPAHDPQLIGHTDWNARLGVHFAAHHRMADKFADPSNGIGGHAGAWEPRPTPSVVHARLRIAKPRFYASEHDMADDAFEAEYDQRKNYIRRYIDAYDERVPYAALDYFSFDHRPDERPSAGDWENFHDWDDLGSHGDRPAPVYRRRQWLNLHPDQAGIVRRFRQRLIGQGHDGILYGVSDPDEQVRSARPESNFAAIAFDPDQIEVVKHHLFMREDLTAVRLLADSGEIGRRPEARAHQGKSAGEHGSSAPVGPGGEPEARTHRGWRASADVHESGVARRGAETSRGGACADTGQFPYPVRLAAPQAKGRGRRAAGPGAAQQGPQSRRRSG